VKHEASFFIRRAGLFAAVAQARAPRIICGAIGRRSALNLLHNSISGKGLEILYPFVFMQFLSLRHNSLEEL